MSKFVTIGCRLPHGLILDHPLDKSKTVELAGANRAKIVGADYGLTQVDVEFWEQWKAMNAEFPALKVKALFVAKNVADAEEQANELKTETTGFEPMRTDGKDKRAKGVKKVTAKDDE